jgi:hypothetical protein
MKTHLRQSQVRLPSEPSPLEAWSPRPAPQAFDLSLSELGSLQFRPAASEKEPSKPATKPAPDTKPEPPGQPMPAEPAKNPNTDPGKGKPCRGGPCKF